MDLTLTAEEEAFRDELRAWLEENHPGPSPKGGDQAQYEFEREWQRKLHSGNWAGVSWPKEYGGRGATLIEQSIFGEELARAKAPRPANVLGLVMGGPVVIAHGTEEQKERFLEPILSAEEIWCQGFSEPESGSDLASLKTKAVKENGGYRITGQKVWTTFAHEAKWCILVARTDPDVPKHKGISILCVPTSSPGFSWTPLHTVGGNTTTTTYYDGVRVPLDNVVGEVNGGWRLLTSQLNHERVGLAAMSGRTEGLWDAVFDWATESGLAQEAWAQADLARTYAQVQAMKLVNWDLAGAVAREDVNVANASAAKVFGTETHAAVCRTLFDLLGSAGARRLGSPGAPLDGRVDVLTRGAIVNTFGGGVNEVLRDLICTSELGMPRGSR
jgi:alkylation response protein AidB-like acyl-CoA dehydrogenase